MQINEIATLLHAELDERRRRLAALEKEIAYFTNALEKLPQAQPSTNQVSRDETGSVPSRYRLRLSHADLKALVAELPSEFGPRQLLQLLPEVHHANLGNILQRLVRHGMATHVGRGHFILGNRAPLTEDTKGVESDGRNQ